MYKKYSKFTLEVPYLQWDR